MYTPSTVHGQKSHGLRSLLASYCATGLLSLGVCSLLWLTGPVGSLRDGLKAVFYCCLGPIAGGMYLVAVLGIAFISAGLVFPRNVAVRLLGSLAIAIWFALGLACSADRLL